jgi:hypothetical protein
MLAGDGEEHGTRFGRFVLSDKVGFIPHWR